MKKTGGILTRQQCTAIFKRKTLYRDPDELLFAKLRFQLILWSSCVLGGILLALVLILGFATPHVFTYFTFSDLSSKAEHIKQQWQINPQKPCPISSDLTSYMIVCFDQHKIATKTGSMSINPAFLHNALSPTLTGETRISEDYFTIDHNTTEIYRYAIAVPTQDGRHILGTIQIGTYSYDPQTILITTFLIGAILLVVICAPLASILLANRAIAPARLAFKRQQEFIANASHELRTPLSLLRADAEVLLRSHQRLGTEDVELLEDIVTEATYMTTLANNMLTLARMDANEQHLELEVIDLQDIVAQLAHRIRSLAEAQNITLEIATEDQSTLIFGDKIHLEQALLIILDNAIKYNRPGGKIMLNTHLGNGRAQLIISDTGIGIAPEHLPQLGNRFYRVDKARSRELGGNGLGLSIARGITYAHNGDFLLTSQVDQGTTVTLSFPLLKHQIANRNSQTSAE